MRGRRAAFFPSAKRSPGRWPRPPGITVTEQQRRQSSQSETTESEELLRFDAAVPVEEIRLPGPALDDEHELVRERMTCLSFATTASAPC